jgi:hypothetical protein
MNSSAEPNKKGLFAINPVILVLEVASGNRVYN